MFMLYKTWVCLLSIVRLWLRNADYWRRSPTIHQKRAQVIYGWYVQMHVHMHVDCWYICFSMTSQKWERLEKRKLYHMWICTICGWYVGTVVDNTLLKHVFRAVRFPARAWHHNLRSRGLDIMARAVAATVARDHGSDSSLLKFRKV